MKIELTSSAFAPNGRIPKRHTGEGDDLSPPLAWSGAPRETKQLALVCDDPDAPRVEPWVHWVLYGIAPTVTALPEAAHSDRLEGRNDFGRAGYGGPMPPRGHGVHHYTFRIYALDVELPASKGMSKAELFAAMKGHVIGDGELVGTYERK